MFVVFVTILAAGLLGVLACCRMQQVAWKFPRLIAILSLCLLVPVLARFAVWAGWQHSRTALHAAGFTAASGFCAFLVLSLAPVARRYGFMVRACAAIGAALALPAAWAWGLDYGLWPLETGPARRAAMLSLALTGLTVGSVSLATALGHAYLTHTSMTIQPLRRLARLFAMIMVVRVVWSIAVGGVLIWQALRDDRLTVEVVRQSWLLLSVRGLIGLAVPTVFAFMVLQTVRLRATQSATGILYFALVLVFVGELTALHLLREMGIAF